MSARLNHSRIARIFPYTLGPLAVFPAIFGLWATAYWRLDHTQAYFPILLFSVAWICFLEWKFPARVDQRLSGARLRQDSPYFLTSALMRFFGSWMQVTVALAVATLPFSFRTSDLPFFWQVFFALTVFDLLSYAKHRLLHNSWRSGLGEFLRRLHYQHHAPGQFNNTLYHVKHPLDLLATMFVGLVPIYLLQVSKPAALTYLVIANVQNILAHSNLDVRLGPLNYLISGPETHAYHHSPRHSGNYCFFFPWIDMLFGTFVYPKQREGARPDCGPELGNEAARERSWLMATVFPFWWGSQLPPALPLTTGQPAEVTVPLRHSSANT